MNVCGEATELNLPTYEVVETGVQDEAAHRLAEHLKIPHERIALREGVVSFVDAETYLAVPHRVISDPEIVESHRRKTKNFHPEIPIELRAIDHEALGRITPHNPEEALRSASEALRTAGMEPEGATANVGHTLFTTVSTSGDGTTKSKRTTKIDTHVTYRFHLDGYLLAGPGAQVQISFGPDGNVTRLHHAYRRLKRARP